MELTIVSMEIKPMKMAVVSMDWFKEYELEDIFSMELKRMKQTLEYVEFTRMKQDIFIVSTKSTFLIKRL